MVSQGRNGDSRRTSSTSLGKGLPSSRWQALDRYTDSNPLTQLCYCDLEASRVNVSRANTDLLRQTNVFLFMWSRIPDESTAGLHSFSLSRFFPALYRCLVRPIRPSFIDTSAEFHGTINIVVILFSVYLNASSSEKK